MTKIYTIDTNHDAKTNSCNLFDLQQVEKEQSSTYIEVLKVFRKVFGMIDFNSILRSN